MALSGSACAWGGSVHSTPSPAAEREHTGGVPYTLSQTNPHQADRGSTATPGSQRQVGGNMKTEGSRLGRPALLTTAWGSVMTGLGLMGAGHNDSKLFPKNAI